MRFALTICSILMITPAALAQEQIQGGTGQLDITIQTTLPDEQLRLSRSRDTRVSGIRGDSETVLSSGNADEAVKSIAISERADNPCVVHVGFAPITNGARTSETADWNECGNDGRTSDAYVGGGGRIDVTLSKQQFVTGVRICTNGRNDGRGRLVKGIDVAYTRFGVKGKFGPRDTVRDEQPNCREWDDWVRCPDDWVATSVSVRHQDGIAKRGRGSVVGLSLTCAQVVYR